MSRFDDLNNPLKSEQSLDHYLASELTGRVNEAREQYLPHLQQVYGVVGDYYATILQPKGYALLPRKKEGLTVREQERMHYDTILFAYVVNVLSPPTEQPYPHDNDSFRVWADPSIGEQDYHVWHPNIGLHVAAYILSHDLEAKEVEFKISMRAWGVIKTEPDAISSQGITMSIGDGGWDHYATFVAITPENTRLDDQVETGLRLLTPNIINHKKAFNR